MAGTVTFKGNTMHLVGEQVVVGDPAPNVTLTTVDFEPVDGSKLEGKVALLSVTPSLDTGVCQKMCSRFDQLGRQLKQELGDQAVFVNVSVDLPPAIKRWTGESTDTIVAVSDYQDRAFGKAYGVLIDELKLLARAVFVIDRNGTIVYKEIVDEVTEEPDYDAAIAAVRKAVGEG